MDLLHIRVLCNGLNQQAEITCVPVGRIRVFDIGPPAWRRRPCIGNECAVVTEEMPQLGRNQYRVFEYHPVAVGVDVDMLVIGPDQLRVDCLHKFVGSIVGFDTFLLRQVHVDPERNRVCQ